MISNFILSGQVIVDINCMAQDDIPGVIKNTFVQFVFLNNIVFCYC